MGLSDLDISVVPGQVVRYLPWGERGLRARRDFAKGYGAGVRKKIQRGFYGNQRHYKNLFQDEIRDGERCCMAGHTGCIFWSKLQADGQHRQQNVSPNRKRLSDAGSALEGHGGEQGRFQDRDGLRQRLLYLSHARRQHTRGYGGGICPRGWRTL